MKFSSLPMYTDSRWLSNGDPSYHHMLSERCTTLSPRSAEMGMNVMSRTFNRAANSMKSDLISS